MHACTHSGWKHAINLVQYTNSHISAKCSQILTNHLAYVKIGLLSWFIMFVGVHVHACTHSVWKHAHNSGQYTNPHISAKWSQIFTKLSANVKIGLLSWFITFVGVHVQVCMCTCARTARETMHATLSSIQLTYHSQMKPDIHKTFSIIC